jgi:transcription initiation factor TFIID/TFIIF subunit
LLSLNGEGLIEVIKRPPFKVEEEGWGEFDLGVTLHFVEKEGTKELTHDLNFQESKYESPHKLVPPRLMIPRG